MAAISPCFFLNDIIYSPSLMMEEINIETTYDSKNW